MKSSTKFKMQPDEYKKVLDGIQLKNLSILETSAKIKPNLKSFDKMDIKITDEANYYQNGDEIVINQHFTLIGIPVGKKQHILTIVVVFALHLTSEKDFTDDFFEIYKTISLPINTWPFLREFANSMTARMNIPPLTLPLLKR